MSIQSDCEINGFIYTSRTRSATLSSLKTLEPTGSGPDRWRIRGWNGHILSVGYTTNDLIYKWNSKRQVAIAEDMKLSQFDLIANPSANQTDKVNIAHSQIYAISKY